MTLERKEATIAVTFAALRPRRYASIMATESHPDLVALLAAHRVAGAAPRAELEWVAARATLRPFMAGETIVARGATEDEILGVASIVGLQAIEYRKLYPVEAEPAPLG